MGTAASVLEGGLWERRAGGGRARPSAALVSREARRPCGGCFFILAGRCVWWRRSNLPGLTLVSADEAEPSLWRRLPGPGKSRGGRGRARASPPRARAHPCARWAAPVRGRASRWRRIAMRVTPTLLAACCMARPPPLACTRYPPLATCCLVFCPFFVGSPMYTLDKTPCQIHDLQMFSPALGLSFHSLNFFTEF